MTPQRQPDQEDTAPVTSEPQSANPPDIEQIVNRSFEGTDPTDRQGPTG